MMIVGSIPVYNYSRTEDLPKVVCRRYIPMSAMSRQIDDISPPAKVYPCLW